MIRQGPKDFIPTRPCVGSQTRPIFSTRGFWDAKRPVTSSTAPPWLLHQRAEACLGNHFSALGGDRFAPRRLDRQCATDLATYHRTSRRPRPRATAILDRREGAGPFPVQFRRHISGRTGATGSTVFGRSRQCHASAAGLRRSLARGQPDVPHHRQADDPGTGVDVFERAAFCQSPALGNHPAPLKPRCSDKTGCGRQHGRTRTPCVFRPDLLVYTTP